jgi:hypothetical protein
VVGYDGTQFPLLLAGQRLPEQEPLVLLRERDGKTLDLRSRSACMILVLSDTHGRDGHRLAGRPREAVREADLVCHCGDFVTAAVLDGFERTVADAGGEFAAVAGNNDPPAVRERLAATRVVEAGGARLAMAHGHEHTDTALGLFGREHDADLVLVGHSHQPSFRQGRPPVLNPGSHADPRWNRPGHAELTVDPPGGRLVEPDGTLIESFGLDFDRSGE